MEFLVAGYEIIDQEPGLEGIYKAAELPGRICYCSQDKMAPGTAETFCKGLMKLKLARMSHLTGPSDL